MILHISTVKKKNMNKVKKITEAMKKNNQLRIAEIENMAHPWTYEIFKQYYFLNSTKANDLIKDSDGGKIWSDLADLSQMVLILLVSIDEFFDELAMVDNRNNNDIFFTTSTKTQLNIQSKLALKLFNCTGALMALVDQARVLTTNM